MLTNVLSFQSTPGVLYCMYSELCLFLHLFDGEVVDKVVVVLVQAAVQRNTVRVEKQVLEKQKGKDTL